LTVSKVGPPNAKDRPAPHSGGVIQPRRGMPGESGVKAIGRRTSYRALCEVNRLTRNPVKLA